MTFSPIPDLAQRSGTSSLYLCPCKKVSAIEAYGFEGKTVIFFATSGGSTIDKANKDFAAAYPKINWKANRWLLEQAGVKPENIQVCGIDTFKDESFFSARREGVKCGRIINSIKLV